MHGHDDVLTIRLSHRVSLTPKLAGAVFSTGYR